MTYEDSWHRLSSLYDTDEAKAIVRWVLDVRFGLSFTDILCGKVSELSADDQEELEKIMLRLEKGEPVQYVIGVADFCGRQFHVAPGVLIPRPETAELCRWITSHGDRHSVRSNLTECLSPCEVIDIGTGSGCIAITLALEIPEAKVTAWDISDEALHIAQENAKALEAEVIFEKKDVLIIIPEQSSPTHSLSLTSKYDIIVSNPPYICDKEKEAMEKNVLEHEPHLALFVPDDDPLLFYRAIAKYALEALKPDGMLFFELNPIYAEDTESMLLDMGFKYTELRKDQYGKLRFLKALRYEKRKD